MDVGWLRWSSSAVRDMGEKVLGFKRGRKREAWITKETWTAIDERKILKQQATEKGNRKGG